MISPPSVCARKCMRSVVTGKTRPRIARIFPASSTAVSKLPVTFSSAEIKRFPKLWPLSAPSVKRYPNRCRNVDESSASATKAWRKSPGGSTPSSSRSIPVDPPSSAVETIAVKATGASRSACNTEKVPVPPPITTICFNVMTPQVWQICQIVKRLLR